MQRFSGCLLPVSALPSPYGVGGFGQEALTWLDTLARTDATHWQLLPLTANSRDLNPFFCEASFALNLLYLDPADLVANQLLPTHALRLTRRHRGVRLTTLQWKQRLARQAFATFRLQDSKQLQAEFVRFKKRHRHWLDDYSLHQALTHHFSGTTWQRWPEQLRRRESAALQEALITHSLAMDEASFGQFLLYRQWERVREHAKKVGITLIGDVAIYPSPTGVDSWVHQAELTLNSTGFLAQTAGAPPDQFNRQGQYWNCPMYRWDKLVENRYRWVVERLSHQMQWFDLLRIDHYYGYFKEWSIPAEQLPTSGHWRSGPGATFFDQLIKHIKPQKLIAENLASEPLAVADDYLEQRGILPMRVWQLDAFDPRRHHEEDYPTQCALYSSTHDTETLQGWFKGLNATHRRTLVTWLHEQHGRHSWHIPRAQRFLEPLLSSAAHLVIIPVQDLLGLDNRGRLNRPGTQLSNWSWRLTARQLRSLNEAKLHR
jgi:4-alpha-glucanotransferase